MIGEVKTYAVDVVLASSEPKPTDCTAQTLMTLKCLFGRNPLAESH